MAAAPGYEYETLAVTWLSDGVMSVSPLRSAHPAQPHPISRSGVAGWAWQVMLNRPEASNAMNSLFWVECRECFRRIKDDHAVRAVVISGAGRNFTAGLDLKDAGGGGGPRQDDIGRRAYASHDHILEIQESFNAIEDCSKPVIACAHGACYGGGIDLLCACDIRLCAEGTQFCIKEVDVGLAADVGTLQRLPKIVGNDSKVRELA